MAPGEEILSLAPGNRTEAVNGTSFSSPIVAGVAALVWSYFPELTTVEVRDIILESARDFSLQEVMLPGTGEKKVMFGTLSATGGIVNAYKAVQLADRKTGLKK
jgi:subtilisin family serine protease